MLLQINKNPSPQELRQLGWTFVIGFGLLGGAFYWREKPHGAFALWGTGVPLGCLALLVPPVAKGLYKVWMGWAFIMATIVTRVILTLLFYALMTPLALLFRCLGRDVLRLKKDSSARSYWDDHRKIADPTYYQRLF